MKRLSAILLALALLILPLSACQDTAAPAADAPGGAAAPSGEGGDYSEPIVVSMNVQNAEKNGIDVRSEIVKEKFNLTFDYVPVSWGDWNEKIRTWVATDDAPDLIWWDLKGAQAQEYASWARQGAFAPFKAEYFENRPNLKNTFENGASIEALSVDGELYSWPSLRDNPPEAQNAYTSHWCYRRDWAKAVGLYKEGDVYTFEEWQALIRAVLEQDPGGNGTANAGLVMANWAFPHAPALFIGPPAAEGNETCSYIQIDGEYVWPPSLPEYRRGVEITYEMYQEGLIFKDNILYQGSEQDDAIRAGLAFAVYNVTGSLNAWTDTMLRDGVIENREDFGIAIVSGWDGNWYMTQTEDYWTVTAMNHKLAEDQPKIDRILDFWEYLHTVDGIRMRKWGREGTDFNATGDNAEDIELLWPFDEATQSYVNPFTNISEFGEGNGALNDKGTTVVGPDSPPYQFEELNRLWTAFGGGEVPAVIKPFDYTVAFGSAPNKDKYGSFGMETKERLISLIAQPGIDIGAEWDKFVEEMMPRVQTVLDELNAGL